MKIGEVYRYSNQKNKMNPNEPIVDGLPNYFYYTYDSNSTTQAIFQYGIHGIEQVTGPDGIMRRPAIIISSSPHKSGTEQTPWEDSYDPDYGYIYYYGDNKSFDVAPWRKNGNRLLLDAFKIYTSPNKEERQNHGVPIVFFKRVPYEGRRKGNLMFQGFGVVEKAELITQYDSNGNYFSNYVFDMCVFSMKEENERFSWQWINARRNPTLSIAQTMKFAPASWKKWGQKGSSQLSLVRRKISALSVIKAFDQQPREGSKEDRILSQIYEFYRNHKHSFEMLAMRVTQYVFSESGIELIPGWVSSKSMDGGIDYVLRMDVGYGLASTKIVILGQAKCEKPDVPTNGQHIARTVARLKRGWMGVYVTTSFFSVNVQQEIIDDQYPIMLINGLKLAETVQKIIFKEGLSLNEYLNLLDKQYKDNVVTRRPDEILKL